MVKNQRAPKERPFRDDEDRIVYCSSFIRPCSCRTDQEIITNSTPKKIEVPSSHDDSSHIPSNHKYEFFLDFKEPKGPDAQLEKPLDSSEIELISMKLDEIVQHFNKGLPLPKTKRPGVPS